MDEGSNPPKRPPLIRDFGVVGWGDIDPAYDIPFGFSPGGFDSPITEGDVPPGKNEAAQAPTPSPEIL